MIRTADRKDIPGIRSLMESIPGLWDGAWRTDVLECALDSACGLALVFEDRGEIVGFVCAHDVGFRAYLSALAVSETARGRGAGAELVGAIESRLAARECRVVIADVWRDAEGFYRALGWSEPDVVLLRRRLERVAS